MNRNLPLLLASAVALGLAACGEDRAPAQQAAPATPPAESTLIEKAAQAAKEFRDEARDQASEAARAAREAADQAVARGRELTEQATAQGKSLGEEALQKGQAMFAMTAEKAGELIQQAKDALDRNQPQLARDSVERLRKVRDSLSEGLRQELDRLDARLASGPQAQVPPPADTGR